MNKHELFMKKAIEQALIAKEEGEVPIGAVLVQNNEIVSSSYNLNISRSDPTAHAEINVIREFSKKIKNYRLVNSSIYVTLEPCLMCYGAIVHSRISNIFFGAFDNKSLVLGSNFNNEGSKCLNHKPTILGGILENECSSIIIDFFKNKREE